MAPALVEAIAWLFSPNGTPYLIAFVLWAVFYAVGYIHLLTVCKSRDHSREAGLGPKILYTITSAYIFFLMAFFSIFGFFIQFAIHFATKSYDKTRNIPGRFFRWIGIMVVKLVPIWSFRVHESYPCVGPLPYGGRSPGKTVVVCNHASMLDPFLISHLPWEMKWLSKIENFKIPFVGWCMKLAGDIPVYRGDRDSAKSAMKMCADYLNQGMPVCIFPEGTRSETDELLPFKDGAFRLAIETEADILPIAIAGSHRSLPKHKRIFHPSLGLVTCGQPISTKGMTMDDLESLKNSTREAIIELRKKISTHASQ